MSDIKISRDQYLGEQELNRLKLFLGDEGYKLMYRLFITSYGVSMSMGSDSLKITNSTGNFVTCNLGLALDSNLQLMYVKLVQTDVLSIPADSAPYLVAIRYKVRTTEIGFVNIGADGSLVGFDGCEFTKVLRGMPSNPVKIRFPDSVSNVGEYDVLEIDGDQLATINTAAILTAESGVRYEVVGSFAPGQVIDSTQKTIYSYDGYEIVLRAGALLDGDIWLASVINDGFTKTITDQRTQNLLSLV